MGAGDADGFRIEPCRKGDAVVLALSGRIAGSNSLSLAIAVAEELRANPQRLVLDLSGLVDASSGGLAGLMMAEHKCRMARCRIILAGAGGQVRQSMARCALDRAMEVVDTLGEALALP